MYLANWWSLKQKLVQLWMMTFPKQTVILYKYFGDQKRRQTDGARDGDEGGWCVISIFCTIGFYYLLDEWKDIGNGFGKRKGMTKRKNSNQYFNREIVIIWKGYINLKNNTPQVLNWYRKSVVSVSFILSNSLNLSGMYRFAWAEIKKEYGDNKFISLLWFIAFLVWLRTLQCLFGNDFCW